MTGEHQKVHDLGKKSIFKGSFDLTCILLSGETLLGHSTWLYRSEWDRSILAGRGWPGLVFDPPVDTVLGYVNRQSILSLWLEPLSKNKGADHGGGSSLLQANSGAGGPTVAYPHVKSLGREIQGAPLYSCLHPQELVHSRYSINPFFGEWKNVSLIPLSPHSPVSIFP